MSKSRQLIRQISEMKRPKDFYLRHYWRDLSDEEKKRLDDRWKQPIWLDSSIRGDWRDWGNNVDKYERILNREVRKQLKGLVDLSDTRITRTSWGITGDEVEFRVPIILFKVSDREKKILKGERIKERLKPLLKKAGFIDSYFRIPMHMVVFGISFFGKRWNSDSLSRGPKNMFNVIIYPIPMGKPILDISLGPFYSARALKLEKAIPKAVRVIRQMILEAKKEIDEDNGRALS